MLNTCRTLPAIFFVALSYATLLQADTMSEYSGLSSSSGIMLADNGNPWALPAPSTDPYGEPAQPYQRGSRFITPEELNSIYKKHDQSRQTGRTDRYPDRRPEQNYYSPGTTFDPLIPGAVYPGVGGGGMYSPYGISPFYTPNNFNNVAPFIY